MQSDYSERDNSYRKTENLSSMLRNIEFLSLKLLDVLWAGTFAKSSIKIYHYHPRQYLNVLCCFRNILLWVILRNYTAFYQCWHALADVNSADNRFIYLCSKGYLSENPFILFGYTIKWAK